MKIIYKHGDLMESDELFIAQGCNAQGVMGRGVAKLIRDEDERVFTKYREVYEKQGNKLNLGQVIPVVSGLHRIYLNCITQEFYGGGGPDTVYVSYEGIALSIENINLMLSAVEPNYRQVAMPLIGAGLARGKWSLISALIEEFSTEFQPMVYLIDGIIPDGVQAKVIPAVPSQWREFERSLIS
jgi:O-acetyl-ADP-ribose deacetylase (regulator of RNase III)